MPRKNDPKRRRGPPLRRTAPASSRPGRAPAQSVHQALAGALPEWDSFRTARSSNGN